MSNKVEVRGFLEPNLKSDSPLLFFFFLFGRTLQQVELPHPGIEPEPPAVEAWSLNHWTTREAQQPITFAVHNQLEVSP